MATKWEKIYDAYRNFRRKKLRAGEIAQEEAATPVQSPVPHMSSLEHFRSLLRTSGIYPTLLDTPFIKKNNALKLYKEMA